MIDILEKIQIDSEIKMRTDNFQRLFKETLETKEELSQKRIKEFVEMFPNSKFKLAFSGGRDSTLLYFLIKKTMGKEWVDDNLMIETAPEFFYPEVGKFLQEFQKKENIKIHFIKPKKHFWQVINELGVFYSSKLFMMNVMGMKQKIPAPSRIKYWNDMYGNKFDWILSDEIVDYKLTTKCCSNIKLSKTKNKLPTFLGLRAEEGQARLTGWKKTGCINIKEKVCKPISLWSLENEKEYIKENNIEISKAYEWTERTGCLACPFGLKMRIKLIFEKYHFIYKQIMKSDIKKILADFNVEISFDKEYEEFRIMRQKRIKDFNFKKQFKNNGLFDI